MVVFDLPEDFSEEFMALVPKQRYVINQMLVEGVVQSYSVANDHSKLWVVMLAETEFDLMEELTRFPLIDYMTPHVSELRFHNSAMEVMQFSMN